MQRHLQCAEQQASPSNLTKCCPCHEKWYASFIVVTYATSFTMREATGISRQPHQILPLPRKMTLMINLRDIWNVIYNARRNRSHPPTSPNAAPATQNDSHHLSSWHMKRYLQCAEEQASPANLTKYCACHAKWLFVTYETSFTMRRATGITLQPHQILRLPRKMTLMIDLRHIWNVIYNARSNRHHPPTSPNTAPATQKCTPKSKQNSPRTVEASIPMRGRFDHDPNMIRAWTRHLAPARSPRLLFALRRRILYWKLQHFALRLSTQISPNTAPATKSDPPTSPNAAPATKNDAHHWLSSHMKRHLQCAEQQASPSNLTKYCACHAKWLSWLIFVTYETSFTMRRATGITLEPHQILRLPRKMTLMIDLRHIWNVIYNARSNRHHPPTSPNILRLPRKSALQNLSKILRERLKRQFQCAADSTMIRPWSEHDPSMNSSSRTRPFAEVTFRASETHFVLKITTFRAPAIYSNFTEYCACHEKWPSNLTKCCSCHEKWCASLIVVAYETSFTMRRATGIALQPHQILRLPRKMTLMIDLRHIWNVIYNAQSNRHNLTKYCACHAKWLSWLIFVTYETSFTMRGATGITLQPHQILRLPRKSALQNLSKILRERLKRQFQCAADSTMIRPWSEHDPSMNSSSRTCPFAEVTFRASETHFVLKITTFRAPAIYSNFTEYCACHEKWPSNLTKCCSCHEKWCESLIVVAYETSFTMRGATGITLQPHQILRLPRKSALQNLSKILRERLKRQFQCAADSTMIRPWSEHDPSMNSSSRTRPFAEVTFRASETHFVLKITTFRAPAIYSNFTEYCACHEKWHSDITKYCTCHEKWHSDITKCCACHERWHSDITKYCACHEKWDCYSTVTELSCY